MSAPENLLRIRTRDLIFRLEVVAGRGRSALRHCPATDAGDATLRECLPELAGELEAIAGALLELAAPPHEPPPPTAAATLTPEPELFAA